MKESVKSIIESYTLAFLEKSMVSNPQDLAYDPISDANQPRWVELAEEIEEVLQPILLHPVQYDWKELRAVDREMIFSDRLKLMEPYRQIFVDNAIFDSRKDIHLELQCFLMRYDHLVLVFNQGMREEVLQGKVFRDLHDQILKFIKQVLKSPKRFTVGNLDDSLRMAKSIFHLIEIQIPKKFEEPFLEGIASFAK